MTLTRADIESVAHLARLNLDDDEIPIHIKNLNNILNLVDQMNTVNTEKIDPILHPSLQSLGLTQPLRADKTPELIGETLRDKFQQNAPQNVDGLYLVPKVIE